MEMVNSITTSEFPVLPPIQHKGYLGIAPKVILDVTPLAFCFYRQGVSIRSGAYSKRRKSPTRFSMSDSPKKQSEDSQMQVADGEFSNFSTTSSI